MIVMIMMMLARTEYMRWKYRNNKEDKISVDESGMTQFDPLLKWEVMINGDQSCKMSIFLHRSFLSNLIYPQEKARKSRQVFDI